MSEIKKTRGTKSTKCPLDLNLLSNYIVIICSLLFFWQSDFFYRKENTGKVIFLTIRVYI